MSNAVSLREIINEMSEISERHVAFLNRNTGELLTLNEQQRQFIDSTAPEGELTDWQREFRAGLHSGAILELPGTFEQKQFTIMEGFCGWVRDQSHRDQLLAAVRGRRAFRNFHRIVRLLGLEDQWIGFRNRAFEQLAVEWLKKNNIVYRAA